MAIKKQQTDDDFTQAPQAKTADDVIGQDARTRLWQSLNYTYGQQRKQSDEQYAQAVSQADRQALSRGMGRSSYNNQTLANIRQKGIEANNNIYSAQIADFQNRIGQIEQQEKEDERWERQFAANREDAAWNKEFQTNQFEYGKQRDLVGDNQWQMQFDAGRDDAAWNRGMQEKQFAANREDTAWNKQFQTSQFEYGKERDLVADAQWQKQYDESLRQFNEQMAYQRERANVSDAQWQKEYEEKLRQFNEQMAEQRRQFDLNFNEDVRRYNNQLAAAGASSGGGGGPRTNPSDTTPPASDDDDDNKTNPIDAFWAWMNKTGQTGSRGNTVNTHQQVTVTGSNRSYDATDKNDIRNRAHYIN